MGLASNPQVVGSSSARMVEELSDPIPLRDIDPAAKIQHEALVGKLDYQVHLRNSASSCLYGGVRNMMRYARKHYGYGLPSTDNCPPIPCIDDTGVEYPIQAYLISSIRDNLKITNNIEIDPNYNHPTVPSVFKCKLTPIFAVYSELYERRLYHYPTDRIYHPPSDVDFSEPPEQNSVYLTHAWLSGDSDLVRVRYSTMKMREEDGSRQAVKMKRDEEDFIIPSALRSGINRDYIIARYRDIDGVGNPTSDWKYWFYRMDTNKYPDFGTSYLGTGSTEPTREEIHRRNKESFLPIIPLRYANNELTQDLVWGADPVLEERYLESKKLLKKINVNIDDVATALQSDQESLEKMEHSYITFGIDILAENKVDDLEIDYLYEHFLMLFYQHYCNDNDFSPNPLQQQHFKHCEVTTPIDLELYLEDINGYTYYQSRYSPCSPLTMEWQGETIWNGLLSPTVWPDQPYYKKDVHTPRQVFSTKGLDQRIQYNYINSEVKEEVIGSIGTTFKIITTKSRQTLDNEDIERATLILKKQVTPTQTHVLTICGLKHVLRVYHAYEAYTTLEYALDRKREANTDVNKTDPQTFIVPVHYGAMSSFPPFKAHQIYLKSLRITAVMYDRFELEWYQKPIGQAIIIIITVILAIWSGQYYLAGLAAALEVGTIAAILWYLAVEIIKYLVIKYVFEWVVDELGLEKSLVVGAIIAIVAVVITRNIGGIQGLIGMSTEVAAMTAQMCMIATNAIATSMNTYVENQLGEIQRESDEYTAYQEDKLRELEEANEDLTDSRVDANPLLFTRTPSYKILDETPESFYNRTIHVNNKGTLVFDMISTFVERNLTLPTTPRIA